MDKYVLLGGAFDPIHNGHLLLAHELYTKFQITVTFLPNNGANYKPQTKTTPQQRLDMLQLALNSDNRFYINTMELFKQHYTPTYISLKRLRKNLGNTSKFYFAIGSDSLMSIDTWDNWEELFALTNFIVVNRPGHELKNMKPELSLKLNPLFEKTLSRSNSVAGKIFTLDINPINISSTQIRAYIKEGQPIDKALPIEVGNYIRTHHLYV